MNYIDTLAVAIKRAADGTGEPSDPDMSLYRLYAVLCLAKGEAVTLEDVHDAWAAWVATERPAHPSLVPFSQLSSEVQALDAPYAQAIRQIARQGVGACEAGR